MKLAQASQKHFLEFRDFSRAEFDYLLSRSHILKNQFKNYQTYQPLKDRTLAMVFEKSSTRTRISFEAGMHQMGGIAINLSTRDTQLARGEPIEDVARVISRMVDIVVFRTYEQSALLRFAEFSRVPVINGLTDEHHPCQILADIFTYQEHRGAITGKTVAWIGDGNNVARSWLQAAAIFEFHLHLSTPPGFSLAMNATENTPWLQVFTDPLQAAQEADLVTTDVWTSMGWEKEESERQQAFTNWQVNERLMAQAKPDALFMHCLPAHRGEEVTAAVLEGPQSVVWDEAENRLHTQKALLEYLLIGHVN